MFFKKAVLFVEQPFLLQKIQKIKRRSVLFNLGVPPCPPVSAYPALRQAGSSWVRGFILCLNSQQIT